MCGLHQAQAAAVDWAPEVAVMKLDYRRKQAEVSAGSATSLGFFRLVKGLSDHGLHLCYKHFPAVPAQTTLWVVF